MKKLVTALAVVALLGACNRKADHDTGALDHERSGMDTTIKSSSIKDTTVVKLGPLEVSAKERQTVNVPIWVGASAIVVGGLLLVFGSKR